MHQCVSVMSYWLIAKWAYCVKLRKRVVFCVLSKLFYWDVILWIQATLTTPTIGLIAYMFVTVCCKLKVNALLQPHYHIVFKAQRDVLSELVCCHFALAHFNVCMSVFWLFACVLLHFCNWPYRENYRKHQFYMKYKLYCEWIIKIKYKAYTRIQFKIKY